MEVRGVEFCGGVGVGACEGEGASIGDFRNEGFRAEPVAVSIGGSGNGGGGGGYAFVHGRGGQGRLCEQRGALSPTEGRQEFYRYLPGSRNLSSRGLSFLLDFASLA